MEELFIGPIIHCNKNEELVIFEYAELLVKNGKIESIQTKKSNLSTLINKSSLLKVTHLKENQFLIPGFIDTHIHPVQLPNLGLGYGKYLLEWLECHTFPEELKYKDNNYAEKVMNAVVQRTLSVGTTTACYFASLYSEASLILAKAVTKYGQRALVGKVNMNCCRDDNYTESTSDSISQTIEFINKIYSINNPLVKPIITPRFALSCDMELMKKLGDIAKEKNLHIQTHISENPNEVKLVKDGFKDCKCYAAVYNKAGLLTDKTILAHAIYLSDDDLQLIKEKKSAIAHCPSSNTLLKSGICDIQRLKRWGVNIGLGTDISGGPSASILDVIRSAIQTSIHISYEKADYEPLTLENVFYFATLGGAASLSLDDQIGNFEVKKDFDALLIDISTPDGGLDHLKDYNLKDQLKRFIYCGDDRNILEVFVAGRRVKKSFTNKM